MQLKISARKSDLARLQAYTVGEAIIKKNPDIQIEYRFKESLGDINLTEPLWKIPEKGVFTEDFYQELVTGETDMVVHSWKDLPTELKPDTHIAATLPRADQRDLLLLKKSHFEKILKSKKLNVFSSSPRRAYNLNNFFKNHLPFQLENIHFESVRGNIPTRIRKLIDATETDGLIVAKAALDRLLAAPQAEFSGVQKSLLKNLQELNWMVLPLSINPNAAAQGALAVEILSIRTDLAKILSSVHDVDTFTSAKKEREILGSYGGGCHQKIGVAVLQRSYGEITFLKGLTTAGEVLDRAKLQTVTTAPRFPENLLAAVSLNSEREPLPFTSLPVKTEALYISRAEAWPTGLKFTGFVWAAGIKTWQQLASLGVWVHGCSESLGENEDPQINILANKEISWTKISHQDGFKTDIATYKVILSGDLKGLEDKEFLFWSSGRQFMYAMEKNPMLLKKHHASGPGKTHQVICDYLKNQNVLDLNKVHIFLDQYDWRQQCKI